MLLLDNCEHVLDAVADLVEAVLAAGSEVKILATSREGLGVRGEHVWQIPTGETPDAVLEHPDLEGKDIPNTGYPLHSPMLVTKTMVMYTSLRSDGTPALFGVDKATGEQVGVVEIDDRAFYGNMTYIHEGRQYVVLQTGPKLTVLALPED